MCFEIYLLIFLPSITALLSLFCIHAAL